VTILLTGASGQLGQESISRLKGMGDLVAVDLGEVAGMPNALRQDLGDLNQVEILLNRYRPDLIVNAAAYTAVDRAEDDSELAFRINGELPGCLARWAQRNDRLLVHYSTDYVFDGSSDRPWREQDETGPLGVYGESKLAGEWAITASGCRHITLRTSWVYSSHGNNFVLTMLKLARQRPSLSIVSDQTGCPTWARNLASVTQEVLGRLPSTGPSVEQQGIFHYSDADAVTWFDFAQAIFSTATELGLLKTVPKLTAVPTSEFPTPATRPLYSVLDTSAIRRTFDVEPAGLGPSLRTCLGEVN
jgi:dTDP-4-dehydrorhamnose reductase